MMHGRVEWYRFIYLYIYLSFYLSICLSVSLSVHLSIYLCIYVSIYLYIYIYIYIYIFMFLMIYLSVYVYLYNVTVEYDCGSFVMLFDDDWPKILLQKTLLRQRERICCLNLNWWNNLNLILMLSNSWDALPSLVNTEMFIINYGYRQTKLSF